MATVFSAAVASAGEIVDKIANKVSFTSFIHCIKNIEEKHKSLKMRLQSLY